MTILDLTWQDHAACGDADPALFFGPENEPERKRLARETKAKAICACCPVRIPCLEFRLACGTQGDNGVWGGEDELERKRIYRARIRAQQRSPA